VRHRRLTTFFISFTPSLTCLSIQPGFNFLAAQGTRLTQYCALTEPKYMAVVSGDEWVMAFTRFHRPAGGVSQRHLYNAAYTHPSLVISTVMDILKVKKKNGHLTWRTCSLMDTKASSESKPYPPTLSTLSYATHRSFTSNNHVNISLPHYTCYCASTTLRSSTVWLRRRHQLTASCAACHLNDFCD